MSMFKFLGGQKPATPPAAPPAGQQNQQTPPADPPAADDPLAGLQQLWQTPNNGSNANQPGTPQQLFAVDPGKLAAAVKNTNFTANIPAEVLDNALKGDAAALANAINLASQSAFHAAVLAVPGMVEPAVKSAQQQLRNETPGLFRQLQLQNTRSENQVLNHPGVAPIVEALKSQAAAHNPSATPQEIMAFVEQQLTAFGSAMVPKPAAGSDGSNGNQQEDFSFLLN